MTVTSWHFIAEAASKSGAKYPELVAAQWACESGWGKHTSGKFNYFGIKGKGTKVETQEWDGAKFITIVDEFKDYSSPEECVDDLVSKWYKDYKGYSGVNDAPNREAAAKELVKQGYATDPRYSEKLIALMNQNSVPTLKPTMADSLVSIGNAVKYYKGEEHQKAAFEYLESCLDEEQLKEFTRLYRSKKESKNLLNVPYFYQRDSKTGHGERSCQSSSIAMVLKYLNEDLIGDDDSYLNIVLRHGDTVSQTAHQKALDGLGIKHEFRMDGTIQDLVDLLNAGYPVPIGILHKGNVSNPSGGGHYITVIGYDGDDFFVHDPFGELDLVNGGYPKNGPTDGVCKRYSKSNLEKRWLISSDCDGWYWSFKGNKKV